MQWCYLRRDIFVREMEKFRDMCSKMKEVSELLKIREGIREQRSERRDQRGRDQRGAPFSV